MSCRFGAFRRRPAQLYSYPAEIRIRQVKGLTRSFTLEQAFHRVKEDTAPFRD